MKEDISVTETAKLLGVSTQTVRNYTTEGKLKATPNERGHRRYNRLEVLAYAAQTAAPDAEKIDPEKLYEALKRRLVVSLGFVKTMVEHGCDRNAVIDCNDVICRQIAPDQWTAYIGSQKSNLAVAIGELLGEWADRDWSPEEDDRVGKAVSDLVDLVADVEFGDDSMKYLEV